MQSYRQTAVTSRVVLAMLLGFVLIPAASARADFSMLWGNFIPGSYGDQNAQIVFVNFVVTGPFNQANVQQSFGQAVQLIQQNGQIMTQNANQLAGYHTSLDPADTFFFVSGWTNLNDGSGGWIAMVNTSETTGAYFHNNDTLISAGPGPAVGYWNSAGYHIRIQGNCVQGNVVYRFNISS